MAFYHNKKQVASKIALSSTGFLKVFSTLRLICMLSLLALLVTSLASCATRPRPGEEKAVVRLSVWGSQQEMDTLRDQVARFERLHPTASVDILHAPESYFQKLHLWVAAGLTPDVMMVNSLSYGLFAQHRVFIDLNDKLATEQKQDFFPQALQAFQWPADAGGETSPVQAAIPRDVSNLVVYVNKDLLKREGLTYPSANWTWQEALALAKQVTKRDAEPKRWGVSFYRRPPLFWLPFVWSWGGNLLNSDTTELMLDEPKALEGLRFYQALAHQHQVAPTRQETGGTPMTQLFLQERLAFLVSGRWTTPFLNEYASFNWDVVPFPQGPAGSRVGIDATGYAISKTTQHEALAWELVEFLTSAEQQEEVVASGLIVPARRSVAFSEAFINPDKLPVRDDVFLKVIENGVPSRVPPRWTEFEEQLSNMLEPVWDGDKTPKEALQANKTQLSSLLEKKTVGQANE